MMVLIICLVSGVKTIIVTRKPLAFYTHCGANPTNLIEYSLDNNINIRKSLRVVHDKGLVYGQTMKFWIVYNTNINKVKTVTQICPTKCTANNIY